MKNLLRSIKNKKRHGTQGIKMTAAALPGRLDNEEMLMNVNSGRRCSSDVSGFQRQFSRQSSIRSNRSVKSSTSNLLKKIDEHRLKTDTEEWQKQQEYNVRRKRRKELKKIMKSQAKLKRVRKLYVISILAICLGIVATFGATIRTVSDGTVFWTYKEQFKIIGPIVTVVGVTVLLVAVGLESCVRDEIKASGELEVHPFIHPDFNSYKPCLSRESSCSSSAAHTSRLEQLNRKWYDTAGEEDFLCSSLASTNTCVSQIPVGNDLTSRWAKAVTITIDDAPNDKKPGQSIPRVDSDISRRLVNAPTIQITDVDASSIGTCSRSNSDASFPRSSSLASLQKLKSADQDLYRTESERSFKLEPFVQKGGNALANDIKLRNISEESVTQLKLFDESKCT